MIAAAALLAAGLSYGLVLLLRRHARPPAGAPQVRLLGVYSPVLTRLKVAVPSRLAGISLAPAEISPSGSSRSHP